MKYQCLLADPPWPQPLSGKYTKHKNRRPSEFPYPTMSLDDILSLPVQDVAGDGCHLWLWTTNAFLRQGFDVMEAWGFKYLAPIHWIKPSGFGNYFVHRSQTVLFGYRGKCVFPLGRYQPNIIEANPGRHSQKPEASYELIEAVSPGPRLELFARSARDGWTALGNELDGLDIRDGLKRLGGGWSTSLQKIFI